jgi:hypothetical protein
MRTLINGRSLIVEIDIGWMGLNAKRFFIVTINNINKMNKEVIITGKI